MVNRNIQFLSKKQRYLIWGGCMFLATVACVAFSIPKKSTFDLAKDQILLRKIGHDILLSSGDSTSRVLPIRKVADDEYQIRFEKEFTFQTDTLVKIIKQSLAQDGSINDYIVNVRKCTSNEVIYGYMMFNTRKEGIVPCSGRRQPKDCYLINLKFQSSTPITAQHQYLIGGLGLITSCGLLLGFLWINPRKKRIAQQYQLGNTLFDAQKRTLMFNESSTELTLKENKLLLIFAQAPNEMIARERLQKEIWEDEGIIVGRSLDMFISKLRKKLEQDQSISLTNIHGKGYKLEIKN